jgi:hypothetical protein
MTRSSDERVLAFLSGDLDAMERGEVLEEIEASPEFAAEVRRVVAGLEAARAWSENDQLSADEQLKGHPLKGHPLKGHPLKRGHHLRVDGRPGTPRGTRRASRRIPAWWVPVATAAAIVATVPATLVLSGNRASVANGGLTDAVLPSPSARPGGAVRPVDQAPDLTPIRTSRGVPPAPTPSFMVVLHGRWPDADDIGDGEGARRADEYWAWTAALADRRLLVAAGDLRWEPGLRLTSTGERSDTPVTVQDPDFLVGVFTVRADSYDEALAIAQECPHLRYGGTVSVRRVGAGFVTVPGMDDWAGQ